MDRSVDSTLPDREREICAEHVAHVGNGESQLLRQLFSFLQDSAACTRAHRRYMIDLGMFGETHLTRDLSSSNSVVRNFAASCLRLFLQDEYGRLAFVRSPSFRVFVEYFRQPHDASDDTPTPLSPTMRSAPGVVPRREMIALLHTWTILLQEGDETLRFACFLAEGFMDKLDALLRTGDEQIRSLAVDLVQSLARSKCVFDYMLQHDFVKQVALMVAHGDTVDHAALVSCVWNCSVFPEGVDEFLDCGVHEVLIDDILLNEVYVTELQQQQQQQHHPHQTQPAAQQSQPGVADVRKHAKAAGALAEMVLVSERARRVCAEYVNSHKLCHLIEILGSSCSFHPSKFSVLLFAATILDYLAAPAAFAVRMILPHLRKFVTENDTGRSHGWGWDEAELRAAMRLLDSAHSAVRVFSLWTVAYAVRADPRSRLVEVVADRSPRQRLAIILAADESQDLLERAVASSIVARFDDAPSGPTVVEELKRLAADAWGADVVFYGISDEVVDAGASIANEFEDSDHVVSASDEDKLLYSSISARISGNMVFVAAHYDLISLRAPLLAAFVKTHALSVMPSLIQTPAFSDVISWLGDRAEGPRLYVDCSKLQLPIRQLSHLIYYCYVGYVNVRSARTARDLILLAHHYDLSRLFWLATHMLVGRITFHNFSAVCRFASVVRGLPRTGSDIVKQGCIMFAKAHAEELFTQYSSNIDELRASAGAELFAEMQAIVEAYAEETRRACEGISEEDRAQIQQVQEQQQQQFQLQQQQQAQAQDAQQFAPVAGGTFAPPQGPQPFQAPIFQTVAPTVALVQPAAAPVPPAVLDQVAVPPFNPFAVNQPLNVQPLLQFEDDEDLDFMDAEEEDPEDGDNDQFMERDDDGSDVGF